MCKIRHPKHLFEGENLGVIRMTSNGWRIFQSRSYMLSACFIDIFVLQVYIYDVECWLNVSFE